MNIEQFESALKRRLRPEPVPSRLDDKIEERLHAMRHRVRVRRRLSFSFAAAGIAVLVFAAYPAASAKALMNRIAGALDDVDRVQMTAYSVGRNGDLTKSRTISYEKGKWRIEEAGGVDLQLFVEGKLYSFDPETRSYVVEVRPEGPFSYNSKGMKLSSLLGRPAGLLGPSPEVRETSLGGRPVLTATFDNNAGGPERTVFYADRKTELPIEVHSYAEEAGKWHLRSKMVFDYRSPIDAQTFRIDPAAPQLSRQDYESGIVERLTSKELGVMPLKQGRVVVRAVDVAADGTVFVAYQSGDKNRSWRGTCLEVRDDRKSNFAPPGDIFLEMREAFISNSEDGKLELEVFIPLSPNTLWPREVAVQAGQNDEGELARYVPGFIQAPDGTKRAVLFPNTEGISDEHPVRRSNVYRKTFQGPTCAERPAYVASLDLTNFRWDIRAQIYKAGQRAREYLKREDFASAEQWLVESIRLKDRHEQMGLGGFSKTDDEASLRQVRLHLPPTNSNR